MKKSLFTFVALLALGFGAMAQDTISGITLKDGYFWNFWPDFSGEDILMNTSHWGPEYRKTTGRLFVSKDDTLSVYGMAIGVETYSLRATPGDSTAYYRELNSMCDTSAYDEAYEMWGLYKRVADSLQRVSLNLPINVKLDAPTYYIDFGTCESGGCQQRTKPMPVYEIFFHQPVAVVDSFYVGRTNRMYEMGDTCGHTYYTWPSMLRSITPSNGQTIRQGIAYYQSTGFFGPHWVFGDYAGMAFSFPIIMPPDSNYVWDSTVVAADTVVAIGDTIFAAGDTIVIAGDTTIVVDGDTIFVAGGTVIISDTTIVFDTTIVLDTAIVGGDTIIYYDTIIRNDTIINYDTLLSIPDRSLLGRLTGVMPNPAAETAKVVSSFGLTEVEVFNLAGERIHTLRLPDTPLTATLDVRRWPSGTYLLRIRTPQGTAVKKLVKK